MLEKIVYVSLGIIISGVFLCMSCSAKSKTPPIIITPTDPIVSSRKDVESAKETLTGTTNTIRNEATEILKKTPVEVKPVIDPHTIAILQQAGVQEGVIKNLESVRIQLVEAEQKSRDFEKAFVREKELKEKSIEREKEAKNSETKALRQRYIGLSVLCFAGTVVCGVLFFTGQVWAKWIGLVCGAGCAGAIFIAQTVALIPWVVGGVIVLVTAIAAWQYIKKNRTIKLKEEEKIEIVAEKDKEIAALDKATEELTETIEAAKPLYTEEARKEVFGDGPKPGFARLIQSAKTREIVKQKRSMLSNLAPKVHETVAVDRNGDGVINDADATFHDGLYPFTPGKNAMAAVVTPATVRPKGYGGNRSRMIGASRGRIILN